MATVQESCMNEEVVKAAATAHGKTAAQVVLRWAVQRGYAIIPKSTKPERLVENADVFSFQLSEDEMKAISALNKNRRFNDPGHFCEAAF